MSWDNDAGTQWPRWQPWDYYGYYYLGPVAIPPRPQFVGLVDRATGATWYIQYDHNTLALSLVSAIPAGLAARVWKTNDGPYVQSFGVRLFSLNGVLSFELASGDSGPGPYAFRSDGVLTNWGQIGVKAVANPNILDTLFVTEVASSP